jgi:hypothetical protein
MESKKLFILLVLLCYSVCQEHQFPIYTYFPDITDAEIQSFQVKYIEEKDPDAKAHYNAILRPEIYDKNKDRKISKNEIREAIIHIIYPKAANRLVEISDEMNRHVKSQIDLFVNNLRTEYLSYKQFASLLMKISANNFIHKEMMRRNTEAKREQRTESEGEL